MLAAARTGSLFAPRRAIVVRRAELFAEDRGAREDGGETTAAGAGGGAAAGRAGDEPPAAAGRSKGRKAAATAAAADHPLAGYVEDPAPDVTLVLVAAKLDKRRRPWKSLLPRVTVHDAAPRRGRALRAYVEEELQRRRARLTRGALDELVQEVGQDLRRLMGEVDKLEAWAGSREITEDDVSALLGRGLAQPLYLLSDAFAARDAARSLALVERLIGEGEEGPRVTATLHRSLRQVRTALALREARVPKGEIGARLLPPNMQFKLDALLDATRRWSGQDLARATRVIGRTDREVKQGHDAAAALTRLVVEACARARATSSRRAP